MKTIKTTWTRPSGDASTLARRILAQTHTLIAGTTGSGKSVLLRSIIHTALLDYPDEHKLILIDPKRTELWPYRGVPHCIGYASEPDEIIEQLTAALKLIDERTRRTRARNANDSDEPDVYVIIDEYADLMTTSKKQAVPLIQRIAQLGRSSRVHLILATQRPTRDIITGAIKVNLDCRIALRVPTPQDSRNIINQSGAELLPQWGYGLMVTPQSNEPEPIKPHYYSQSETRDLADRWSAQTQAVKKARKRAAARTAAAWAFGLVAVIAALVLVP